MYFSLSSLEFYWSGSFTQRPVGPIMHWAGQISLLNAYMQHSRVYCRCSELLLRILPVVDSSIKQSRAGFNWEVRFIVPGTNSYWLVLSTFPLFVFLFASQQQICSVSGFGSQPEFTDYYTLRARSLFFFFLLPVPIVFSNEESMAKKKKDAFLLFNIYFSFWPEWIKCGLHDPVPTFFLALSLSPFEVRMLIFLYRRQGCVWKIMS